MDLSLSQEETSFREEVRRFLREELTPDLRDAGQRRASWIQEFHSSMAWHRILARKGWAAPSWPREYGGTGWTAMQWFIFENECARADAPILTPLGLRMLGPLLIGKGRYSEPGAGSDLASLQTRAVADGDDYIVNGRKIWTTFAHYADWIFCLVRTSNEGRPQQGISFLLIDMHSTGIEVTPIVNIAGEHEFNQVTFTDVRVPQTNRVGLENEGWDVAKYLLEFERFRVASPEARRLLRNVQAMVRHETVANNSPPEPQLTAELAEVECCIDALEVSEMRNVARLTAGQNPGSEASILMALQADIIQKITELGAAAAGYYGMVLQPLALTPAGNAAPIGPLAALTLTPSYLSYRMRTIGGGTAEVQRNIVAKTVLGM
jgi:acyl-CoA dehydrogenase